MKTIQRNRAPECLSKRPKNQTWHDFAGTPCHANTRNSLAHEQSGLCCYCENTVGELDGHIEHMEPRSRNQERTYDYSNLALSCNGSGNGQHCGHFKDGSHNRQYEWDPQKFSTPHDPETSLLFSYDTLGQMSPADHHPEKAGYMIGYLNLNHPALVQRRYNHACTLIDTMQAQPDLSLLRFLRECYLRPGTSGSLQPFYSLSQAILNP